MKSFAGSVVAVTGAGSGIGRATAAHLASLGADVLAVDVREDRLEEVRQEITARGGRVSCHRLDVSDREAVAAFAGSVLREKGRLDVLINNAGVGVGGEIKDVSLDDWEWLVRINYWGVVYGVHYFLPAMIERRSGHIVNVASANGLFSMPFEGVYSSTKFAVVGLSETLRAELGRFNIGVTTVCPGLTRTTIMREARMTYGSDQGRKFLHNFQNLLETRGTDPAVVARALARGVLKNRAVVRVPFHVTAVDWVHRLTPWLYRAAIASVSNRMG